MWEPDYRVAATAPDGRFTIVLGELEYDDPFSAIISYDPRLPQPWSRVDVQREIYGLTYIPYGQGELVPVALSNEGDVYTLFENVQRSKIPGVGIGSEDADGRGSVEGICAVGETLYVAGRNGQFYQSMQEGWERISLPDPHSSISSMRPIGETGLLLVCEIKREIDPADLPPWDETNDDTFIVSMNARLAAQTLFRDQNPPQSVFFIYDDGIFTEIPAPLTRHARSAAVDVNGKILVTGLFDMVLFGDAMGLARIETPKRNLSFVTGVLFRDGIWLGSSYEIHLLKNGQLSDVTQKLEIFPTKGRPTPQALIVQDGKLYYFDHKYGVRIFDGNFWGAVSIPRMLQIRKFDPSLPLEP